MFKIKIPSIEEVVQKECPENCIENALRHINLNEEFFNNLKESREEVVKSEFKKRMIFRVLPELPFILLTLSAITEIAKVKQYFPVLIPIASVLVVKGTMKDVEKIHKNLAYYDYLVHIRSKINKNTESNHCLNCVYYNTENQNYGVDYIQCAVNPYIVNTHEAVDCIDYSPNRKL